MFLKLKTEKYKNLLIIIFYGAMWGLFEATIGYLLHLLPIKMGFLIWFPLAFYFMNQVYNETKQEFSIMLAALIASSIKLLNLFMTIRIDYVINPSISIILEALMVFSFIYMRKKLNLFDLAFINFSWRALFVFYLFLMPTSFQSVSVIRTYESFLQFFLVDCLASTAVIFVIYYYLQNYNKGIIPIKYKKLITNPIIVTLTLILAIFSQFIL